MGFNSGFKGLTKQKAHIKFFVCTLKYYSLKNDAGYGLPGGYVSTPIL